MHEFEIRGYLGEGGFSIVYLAWDHVLEREVALKEYMPSSLAARDGDTRVFPRSERHRETFDLGLRSFINEGRLLAQFDHPSLVKVYRFWELHGTAYMVMPFYRGVTLKERVKALDGPPDEPWLRGILDPLTAALQILHRAQCYHRDIAPDNIMLLAETEQPLLLDFGAARKVVSDRTQNLTVILKPGFAPIEQYAEDPEMKQGPWTDVYALSAVVHWCLVGRAPPAAVTRVFKDPYVPLAQSLRDRYSAPLLDAVDRGLAQHPEQRLRSVSEWRAAAGLISAAEEPRSRIPVVDDDATRIVGRSGPTRTTTDTPRPVLPSTPAPSGNVATSAGAPSQPAVQSHADEATVLHPSAQAAATSPRQTNPPFTPKAPAGVEATGIRTFKGWMVAAGAGLALVAAVGIWSQSRPELPKPAAANPTEVPAPVKPAASTAMSRADVSAPAPVALPPAAVLPTPDTERPRPTAGGPGTPSPRGDAQTAPAAATNPKARPGVQGADRNECARLMALESLGDLDADTRARKDRACAGR